MYARNTGDDERRLLYLVPDPEDESGDEASGGKAVPGKIIAFPGVSRATLRRSLPMLARSVLAALVAALLFMPQLISRASTSITIDTDVLFGSVNDWIATFLPIFAIGLGIAIALAIIAIVGDSILMGLRRGIH